jgi:hypothetical protein
MCRVLLIAASRRAHVGSTCFLFQAACRSFPVIGPGPEIRAGPIGWSAPLPGIEERSDLTGVQVLGGPQGPTERPTALCQIEAPNLWVQPRSPSGEAVPSIGDEDPVDGHDAQ